jgi:two-component system sensor histidine kinase CpxA
MKARPYFPLLAKVLGWLFLHLLILALAFAGFVGWQLGLGLDSLLSGSAGDRLRSFGDSARDKVLYLPPMEWNQSIAPLAMERKVRAVMFDPQNVEGMPITVPANVLARARVAIPPQPRPPARRGPPPPGVGGQPPGGDDPLFPDEFDDRPPPPARRFNSEAGARRNDPLPSSQPMFLMRGAAGDGYWAGVQLFLPARPGEGRHPRLLLVRADTLDGSGMFFDFKPWLLGGLAVLALSLAFWTPFVWGITRYVRRLTIAADRIAAGQFNVSLPVRGNDELGNLGHAIETMAGRLDHLVSGQKRFLGDAAHELCAPLARLRTGLGILEMKLPESDKPNLLQIESDTGELAALVEEILAFSRAGNRAPRLQLVALAPLVREVAAKEGGDKIPTINIPDELAAVADASLLSRAIGNLVRNSRIHAGPEATIEISATAASEFVEITVTDNGPGVPADELARLFEPFYRPDLSRSRDTGGTGLGLAIVRTAIEACGGEATASIPQSGGFSVMLRLRRNLPTFDGG